MPRNIKPGIQALYNHNGVKYFPFGSEPGSSIVLSAEPWTFLRAYFRKNIDKTRSENKYRFQRALYYSGLAEEFCRAAEVTRLPAKATLVYYGILNLAKCFICVKRKKLGDSVEHHGLSPSDKNDADIRITKKDRGHVSIFHEFAEALGSPTPHQCHYKFNDFLLHIPEVHEVSYRLGLLPDNKRNLLPIDIAILSDEEEDWLFTEMTYWKKHGVRLNTDKVHKDNRLRYFREPREVSDGRIILRCKRRKKLIWRSYKRIYRNICSDYKSLDIVTLLTRDGYRYYCDLNSPKYHHLAYSFMALFYLGTVTRYNPAQTELLLNGELRPVVSEMLTLAPKQFIYQLTSYMTESVCVVPYSKI